MAWGKASSIPPKHIAASKKPYPILAQQKPKAPYQYHHSIGIGPFFRTCQTVMVFKEYDSWT